MLLVSPSDGVHFLSKGTAVASAAAAAVAEQGCHVDEDDDEIIDIDDDEFDDDDDDGEISVVEKRKASIRRVMGGEGKGAA